jgi:aminopeptidase N
MTAVDTGAHPASDEFTRRSDNLSRQDAAKRAATIAVQRYQIAIDLTDGNGSLSEKKFHSTTTVTFTAAKPAENTFIDIAPGDSGNLRSATLNGDAIDIHDYKQGQGLTLKNLGSQNSLVVDADYTYSDDGEGLYRFDDTEENQTYLYSQFESAAAKRVFACFDQPDLKASFELTVTAPGQWEVVSNAKATNIASAGTAKVHTFAPTAPISTYLVAVIAGPYACHSDVYSDTATNVEIPLRIFCRQSLEKHLDAEQLFALTKKGFTFYHKAFGVTYPFGKYDQIFCPAYNAGAMENVGAVTFTETHIFRGRVTNYQKSYRAETLLHEMAHMWFGDLVTMNWWDDLWLNEAFATWASNLCLYKATEFVDAWTAFANVEKPKGYRQDQLPTTHPVADDDVASLDQVGANFDNITYIKGASILKQLVAYVGLDRFLAGLGDYFKAHAYGNATFDDLLTALQKRAPDRPDLHEWAKQWLKTTGLNALGADFDAPDGTFNRFAIQQGGAQPGTGHTRTQHIQIEIYDENSAGKLVCIHGPTAVDIVEPSTEVPQMRGAPRGKLILVNGNDDTYCSLQLDPRSLDTALHRIGDIDDPLPRAQVWSALWEMTRNGALRARDFVSLVTSKLHTETQIAVVQNLITQVQTALTSYTDPAWATEHGWPAFTDRLLELAQGAPGGSDMQLACINGLGADAAKERQRSSVLLSQRTIEVLSALLDVKHPETLQLPGLCIDDYLRWRIVIALATAGVSDADRLIEAQFQTDPSEMGRLNREQALAARPLPASKEDQWTHLMEKGINNVDARARAAGFAAPGQAALLAPYTSRYFEAMIGVWNSRSEPIATTIANGLYPVWDISADAIAAAEAFLCRPDLPGPLCRWIREGQADAIRALAARAVDAQPAKAVELQR